ncbi:recombinase family protein [Roseomonas sp. CAU 1739]|uniref:recombinase family protein n=1 Tax=Roseomonas sp. CAU 1739 TaxID=3140364 RepID=UPI00325C2D78
MRQLSACVRKPTPLSPISGRRGPGEMAVYGYTRVSTEEQSAEGHSLDAQARMIAGKAMTLGDEVARVFVDAGVSGGTPIAQRPQGAALLAALRKGDVVIAAALDRMFRDTRDALNTIHDFKQRGVSLRFLNLFEGGDVVFNGHAKMLLTILAAFAEEERAAVGRRTKAIRQHLDAQGAYAGGKVPYGYSVGADGMLVPVAAEQEVIAAARTMRAEGASLRDIRARIEAQHGARLALDTIARVTKLAV